MTRRRKRKGMVEKVERVMTANDGPWLLVFEDGEAGERQVSVPQAKVPEEIGKLVHRGILDVVVYRPVSYMVVTSVEVKDPHA